MGNNFDDNDIFSVLVQAFGAFNESASKLSAAYKQISNGSLGEANIIVKSHTDPVLPELLYKALDYIPDGILIMDPNGLIQYANKAIINIIGLRLSDLIGKSYNTTFGDDGTINTIHEGGSLDYQKQINDIMLNATAKPLFHEDGNMVGAFVIFSNAKPSDNKQGDDISDYVTKLMKVMSDIIINIAQQMRSPLGAIQIFAEILEQDIDPHRKHIIQDILASVHCLDAVLSNLLSSVNPIMPNMSELSIINIIEESLNVASSAIKQQGIILNKIYSGENFSCRGDIEQLKQVCFNIILNAIQAMPDGGNLTVHVKRSHDMKYIETDITDSGIGIPEELKDRVFTPFFTTKEGGTGLGLYVAYRIIQAHKGKITINRTNNNQTTACVKLPSNFSEA